MGDLERILNEYSDESADQDRMPQKRLDQMRYYGGLGKRNKEKKYFNKKSKTDIDRLRFMGSIGK